MRGIRQFFASLLILACAWPVSVSAASGIQGSPKILNLYLGWEIKESDLPALARWDLLVLDVDQQRRYPDFLRRLRNLNPQIKILAYVSSCEIAQARFLEPTDFPMGRMAADIQDNWYLRAPNGNRTEFWPGSSLLNVTNLGPAAGERWSSYLPRFIRDQVMSSGLWDGIFLDNTFVGISYFAKGPVDFDRDGRAEAEADANAKWQAGMRSLINNIRNANPNALLLGNGGTAYADILHGVLLENFPSWNWNENVKEYRDASAKNIQPKLAAINVNTKNQPSPQDYRQMRFGLASALMDDGYYSFDQGDWNHNVIWWYDEYSVSLGAPRTAAKKLADQPSTASGAVWSRAYERGMAIVNATNATRRVSLPGVFEKLRGTQDPGVNNGALVRTVDVPAQDGIILLGRNDAGDVSEAPYINGSFVRVFDAQGKSIQNGFFAQRDDTPSGVLVETIDLDGDQKKDMLSLADGTMTVRLGNGTKPFSFKPFPHIKQPRLQFAVGNVNRDSALEIIVSRDGGGPSEVRVFDLKGKLAAQWVAYNPAFLGGARIAVGDVDGDGLREVITAAGPGGGPHVKIWKTDGKNWGGSFFAFDQGDVGGVSVAVGDVDGDGRDEIIVGSGRGSIPRVRIFDFQGTLKQEFRIGTAVAPQGVTVAASDINGDGKKEILVMSQSPL